MFRLPGGGSGEKGGRHPVHFVNDELGICAFVNDESIVGNASLFFGVACVKVVCFATIPDICLVPLPVLAQHSYQTNLLIGMPVALAGLYYNNMFTCKNL